MDPVQDLQAQIQIWEELLQSEDDLRDSLTGSSLSTKAIDSRLTEMQQHLDELKTRLSVHTKANAAVVEHATGTPCLTEKPETSPAAPLPWSGKDWVSSADRQPAANIKLQLYAEATPVSPDDVSKTSLPYQPTCVGLGSCADCILSTMPAPIVVNGTQSLTDQTRGARQQRDYVSNVTSMKCNCCIVV